MKPQSQIANIKKAFDDHFLVRTLSVLRQTSECVRAEAVLNQEASPERGTASGASMQALIERQKEFDRAMGRTLCAAAAHIESLATRYRTEFRAIYESGGCTDDASAKEGSFAPKLWQDYNYVVRFGKLKESFRILKNK